MARYKVNLLGLPKDETILKCFVAPKGYMLGQLDFSSLEPTTLAHFSQDETLQAIYGKAASPYHDIYFAAGMEIPKLGDTIKKYYDLSNPNPDKMKELKTLLKSERSSLLKPSYLGFTYGLGKETLSENLQIPVNEAAIILGAYKKQFKGIRAFANKLKKEWYNNNGYFINGRGRPIAVDHGKLKDLVNRHTQSTGHDILQRFLYHFDTYRTENKVPIIPYIPDIHDETVWAVPLNRERYFAECADYAFKTLNEELNWSTVIKTDGYTFGESLAIRLD